jgi:hypothetical protein
MTRRVPDTPGSLRREARPALGQAAISVISASSLESFAPKRNPALKRASMVTWTRWFHKLVSRGR